MSAHPWTPTCHRHRCYRTAAWRADIDGQHRWLCDEHAAEIIFYGHGRITPLEAATPRYEAHEEAA